jgi:predicted DNA-binding transcriptional regulator YafY
LAPVLPEGVLAVVQQALAARRCLRLEYRMKGRTEPSSLLVHPVGLLLRGRVTYLVGTLLDGDEGRELALHRISAASLDAAKAMPPAGLTLKAYAAEAWAYRSRGVIELVADFDAPAAEHLAETPISRSQRLEPLPDGRVRLTAEVEDGEQLRWWLLGFGSQVRVRFPLELLEALAEESRLMNDLYATPKK